MVRVLPQLRLLAMLGVAPFALAAQGVATLGVRPIQDLKFGILLPGVPSAVAPTSIARSGQFEVQASAGTNVQVRVSLPGTLAGATSQLPIFFSNNSIGVSATGNPADMSYFNPKANMVFRFSNTTRATFYLGGEARPTATQATGAYSAPVIITITTLGN